MSAMRIRIEEIIQSLTANFTSDDIYQALKDEFADRVSFPAQISNAIANAKHRGEIVQVGRRSIGPKQHYNVYAKVTASSPAVLPHSAIPPA